MSTVNTDYTDYGYDDAEPINAHGYIFNKLVELVRADASIKTILDAGCGNGSLAVRLSKLGFQTCGFDLSETGIAQANKNWPDMKFRVGSVYDDMQAMFDGRQFDCVLNVEVIEHLYMPRVFVKRAYDALRPGGMLLLTTPYHGYLKNVVMAVSGTLDKHFTALWDGGHIKFWSHRTLSVLLEEAGFKVETFAGVGRVPYVWKSMILTARKPGSL